MISDERAVRGKKVRRKLATGVTYHRCMLLSLFLLSRGLRVANGRETGCFRLSLGPSSSLRGESHKRYVYVYIKGSADRPYLPSISSRPIRREVAHYIARPLTVVISSPC